MNHHRQAPLVTQSCVQALTTPRLANNVRTLFISDLHLGSNYCHPDALDALLRRVHAQQIYVVGDFFDDWLLPRHGRCGPLEQLHAVASTIRRLTAQAEVHYLLGNHDRELRDAICRWGLASLGESRIHTCADGKRLLVVHGDQYDRMQRQFPRTARFAARLHEGLLCLSKHLNQIRRAHETQHRQYGTLATIPFKRLMQTYSRFEVVREQAVRDADCDGIVFGHTHAPLLVDGSRGLIANTGDWLENCTAIVESHSGQLELWGGRPADWLDFTPRRIAVAPPLYHLAPNSRLETTTTGTY